MCVCVCVCVCVYRQMEIYVLFSELHIQNSSIERILQKKINRKDILSIKLTDIHFCFLIFPQNLNFYIF
jgi:intracellular septation protein A